MLSHHSLVLAPMVPQLTALVLLVDETEECSGPQVLVLSPVVLSIFDLA